MQDEVMVVQDINDVCSSEVLENSRAQSNRSRNRWDQVRAPFPRKLKNSWLQPLHTRLLQMRQCGNEVTDFANIRLRVCVGVLYTYVIHKSKRLNILLTYSLQFLFSLF